MSYIYSTGNEIVDSLRGINFTGNIIPQNWYKTIVTEKGKPDLTAIVILADIVYWYRPRTVRSEETGEEIGLEKKFHDDDYLQRSYKQIEELFGLSKCSARNAVIRLENIGVIERIRKNIHTKQGNPLNNVTYLKLKVPELLGITFPDLYPKKAKNVENGQDQKNFSINNKSGVPLQKKSSDSSKILNYPSFISETNTEITTEITSNITTMNLIKKSINPSIEEITKKVKTNISYDYLVEDRRIDSSQLNEILNIMVEILQQEKGVLFISDNHRDIEEVKARFLEINQFHIEYILECLNKVDTEIKNFRAYIISTVFNAPTTINLYYANRYAVDQKNNYDY